MRIWFRIISDARPVASETVEAAGRDTRTHKVFAALEEACLRFDLARPIWFDANVQEFQRRAATRFGKDNFVEEVNFDYLEMQVLEED